MLWDFIILTICCPKKIMRLCKYSYLKLVIWEEASMSRGKQNFRLTAITILKESKIALSPREVFSRAKKKGLIKSKGKTPEATMRGVICLDIKNKGTRSAFKRVGKGKYLLNK
jgi:hypothetical protein